MTSGPTIHINEFSQNTTFDGEIDNYQLSIMNHPDFGKWEQKSIDLGFIKITEHKADLKGGLKVYVKDESAYTAVHHCVCLGNAMGAHFDDHDLAAELQPGSYHYFTAKSSEYHLSLQSRIHNVHLQISRDYYNELLSDNEGWSAALKQKMDSEDVCYTGRHPMTPAMTKAIYEVFANPLSGSLKKLMVEAKILELVALQWDMSLQAPGPRKNGQKELLHEIRSFLTDHFLEDHSLKNICKQFGINEFALKSGFKDSFNSTVFEYLLTLRLEHARELLRSTDLSVQEVGSRVGYKYPNHFSTAFKNRFGLTPGSLISRR